MWVEKQLFIKGVWGWKGKTEKVRAMATWRRKRKDMMKKKKEKRQENLLHWLKLLSDLWGVMGIIIHQPKWMRWRRNVTPMLLYLSAHAARHSVFPSRVSSKANWLWGWTSLSAPEQHPPTSTLNFSKANLPSTAGSVTRGLDHPGLVDALMWC